MPEVNQITLHNSVPQVHFLWSFYSPRRMNKVFKFKYYT